MHHFCDVASAGGTLGLCLGFSGLSLIEMLYFLTLRVWFHYKKKQMESRKKSEGDNNTTVLRERTSVTDWDSTTAGHDPLFIKRKQDLAVPSKVNGGRELPRVSIEDECSSFVELE